MMKKILPILVLVLAIQNSFAQPGGWRPGEMEVRVELQTDDQKDNLFSLGLNGDIYTDHALLYVIPGELEKVNETGLKYTVLKDNLNEYYKDFWSTRDAYHTWDEIIELMDSLATFFPQICKKHIYGSSVGGKELSALKISDNVILDENEAEILFDGGMHGDEIGGAENSIRFARQLCLEYGTDPDITELVNTREIWIYCMVNPDGRANMTRYNNNGVDLNRDWGYMWDAWGGSSAAYGELESKALLGCILENQFVMNVTFHSGTEYFLYPWYYRPDLSPDNAECSFTGQLYASVSGYNSLDFGHAYLNLYPTNGTSGEAVYGIAGSLGFTMEISFNKQPPVSQIMYYYNINYPSMIEMIRYSGYGLKGMVTDSVTGDPVPAIVTVDGKMPVYNDPEVGDFHKFLLSGTYDVTVMANGYKSKTITGVNVLSQSATEVNFELTPEEGQYVYRFCSSQIPDNNFNDEGNTPAVPGKPDNINYSIGKSGWCVLDMQYPVFDGPGPDIRIHEGDASPESYYCYASSSMHGPWQILGNGTGTAEFDLGMAGMPEARYFKILDDGDGPANTADAGFDLDAIEAIESPPGVYIALMDYVVDDNASGNGNGKLDPGETPDIHVTVRNNGNILAENVTGAFLTLSPFISIISASGDFGDILPGETSDANFTIAVENAVPPGTPAEIELDISSNSGAYSNSFVLAFIIGQVPVLIIDLDENHNSAPAMEAAILANGVSYESTTSFPSELQLYSSVFLCLGIYSDNHVLSASEGQALAAYLNGGGMLYMEGGDTWYYDDQTAVHSMFNINGTDDGTGDLGTINGQTGTFTENMSFSYSGDNNWIDHIEPLSPAYMIFQNQSPSYGTGVANDAGTYRTIGCSHEFGGLDDGSSPSTREELMLAYLEFFGITGESLQANFFTSTPEICEENSVAFTDYSTGNIVSRLWYFPGGEPSSSTEEDPVVLYEQSGSYDVSLVVSNGQTSDSIAKENYILVNPLPEVTFGVLPDFCIYDQPYQLQEGLPEGGYYEGPGVAPDGYFHPDSAGIGSHILSYTFTDESGCSNTATQTVLVDECTGIDKINLPGVFVYPNPVKDRLNIVLHSEHPAFIKIGIYNCMGKIIYEFQETITNSKAQISWNSAIYEPGIYFLKVTKDDESEIFKIISE